MHHRKNLQNDRCTQEIQKEDNGEAFWVRKYIEAIEELLADTDLIATDGEGVCVDIRAPSSRSSFGRRVDLLVSMDEAESAINLASFEAKKDDASVGSQLYQQIKNHRINAAILNRAHCLSGTIQQSCIYLDIIGSMGYFVQISRHKDYLVCQPLVFLNMATDLVDIGSTTKEFLVKLNAWKKFIVDQSIELKKSMRNRKRNSSLAQK